MSIQTLGPLIFSPRARQGNETIGETPPHSEEDRRKVLDDLISGGACDSEEGVRMLMAVFPRHF